MLIGHCFRQRFCEYLRLGIVELLSRWPRTEQEIRMQQWDCPCSRCISMQTIHRRLWLSVAYKMPAFRPANCSPWTLWINRSVAAFAVCRRGTSSETDSQRNSAQPWWRSHSWICRIWWSISFIQLLSAQYFCLLFRFAVLVTVIGWQRIDATAKWRTFVWSSFRLWSSLVCVRACVYTSTQLEIDVCVLTMTFNSFVSVFLLSYSTCK